MEALVKSRSREGLSPEGWPGKLGPRQAPGVAGQDIGFWHRGGGHPTKGQDLSKHSAKFPDLSQSPPPCSCPSFFLFFLPHFPLLI